MSKDMMMFLIIGGGFLLPMILIGWAVSHFGRESEKQFYAENLDKSIKQYLSDTNQRREFNDEDKIYLTNKINSKFKNRIIMWVCFTLLQSLVYIFVIYKRRIMGGFIILECFVAIDVIFVLLEIRKRYKNIHMVQNVSRSFIMKGYVYKIIRNGRYSIIAGDPTIVLLVFFDYISGKYKTYETRACNIIKRNIYKIDYVDLICKEEEKMVQVVGVFG